MSLYDEIPSPCYIVDEQRLRNNLALIKSVADDTDTEFILAFKAFSLWRTFPIFREYIRHTTASSLYEARLAWDKFGSKAHTYSPAYEDTWFDELLKYSSHITFNSLTQYARFHDKVHTWNAQHADSPISIGLRINPEYSEIETELYNPCAPGSRFGILSQDLPEFLPEDVEGFHCHCHCESSSENLERTLQHLVAKFKDWLPHLKWLNLGGGHLLTRKDYNIDLLRNILKKLHADYPNLRLIMEPGSAFAWQTGELVSTVVDIVENKGIKTALLNVSFTCHMPDCLEMPYMPIVTGAEILPSEIPADQKVHPCVYRLGGNSCLSGDFLGYWKFPQPLCVGDKVIFEDMIHYTTVKTTMFNGIHHPALAIRHSNGEIEVYKTFNYMDYMERMS